MLRSNIFFGELDSIISKKLPSHFCHANDVIITIIIMTIIIMNNNNVEFSERERERERESW